MTRNEFFENYIVGNAGNVEDIEVQKLWIKYGFTDILIDTMDIFTDKDVIEAILSSNIWDKKIYSLQKGKIVKIKPLREEEIVEHLYEIEIEFYDEIENVNYKRQGIGKIEELSKYKNKECYIISQIDKNKVRFCCLLTNIN